MSKEHLGHCAKVFVKEIGARKVYVLCSPFYFRIRFVLMESSYRTKDPSRSGAWSFFGQDLLPPFLGHTTIRQSRCILGGHVSPDFGFRFPRLNFHSSRVIEPSLLLCTSNTHLRLSDMTSKLVLISVRVPCDCGGKVVHDVSKEGC